MKIIFMGTPEFSCPTLEKIITNKNHEILAVYSREPKVANRGHKVRKTPIHELAIKHNIKVLTPKSLKEKSTQEEFANFNADIAVVVAYGLILPKEILEGTKYGCINLHPSILPKWRGASPIQRPIMAGEKETGVTIIKMNEDLDSGDMITQEIIPILEDDDYITMSTKLSNLGANLLTNSLEEIEQGKVQYEKQNDNLSTYASKITKKECEINWQEDASSIHNKIRGLSGLICAYFYLNDEKIKVYKSSIIDKNDNKEKAGKILNKDFHIQCKTGIIKLEVIQRPGKKAMSVKDFMAGNSNLLDHLC